LQEAIPVKQISKDETGEGGATPELPPSVEIIPGSHEQAASARRLHYQVGVTVREVYDDNINLGQVNRDDDFYTTIEPSIDLSLGDPDGNFLTLNYSPNAFIFVNHSENNALQHLITLTGSIGYRPNPEPSRTFNLAAVSTPPPASGQISPGPTWTAWAHSLNLYHSTEVNCAYGNISYRGSDYSISDYPDHS
jgi:hypothetical protein